MAECRTCYSPTSLWRDESVKTLAKASGSGIQEQRGVAFCVLEGEQINPIGASQVTVRLQTIAPSNFAGNAKFKTVAVGTAAEGQSAWRKASRLQNGGAVPHRHESALAVSNAVKIVSRRRISAGPNGPVCRAQECAEIACGH